MKSDLSPQNLVALDNSIWPDADYLALALIIDNNGSSIRALPVHNDQARAGEDDAIIAPADSGLDFAIVVTGLEPRSLPVSAFAGNGRRMNKEVFAWLKSGQTEQFSKSSGKGVEQIHGSSASRWRTGFISAFEQFRLNCWKREFIDAGEKKAARQDLPSLAAILHSLQSSRQSGVFAAKSAKLAVEASGQSDLIRLIHELCQEAGCEESQISRLESMSAADIFEFLTIILKK